MKYHEIYEKRNLNMEYNDTELDSIKMLIQATTMPEITQAVGGMSPRLIFVKDFLPDGTPCWRLPTEQEQARAGEQRYGI